MKTAAQSAEMQSTGDPNAASQLFAKHGGGKPLHPIAPPPYWRNPTMPCLSAGDALRSEGPDTTRSVGRNSSLSWLAAGLAWVLMLAAALVPDAAFAQTTPLLSNTGQTSATSPNSYAVNNTRSYSQAIQTGNDEAGYTVTGVILSNETANFFYQGLSAKIESDSGGNPSGTAVAELTVPVASNSTPAGDHEFSVVASGGVLLETSTVYHIVLSYSGQGLSGGYQWISTAASAVDSGAAAGWSIPSAGKRLPSGGSWGNLPSGEETRRFKFQILGSVGSNSIATGKPAIEGVNRVNETLTANTDSIMDDDGLGPFTYEWLRVIGSTTAEIQAGVRVGTNSNTYMPALSDLHQHIVVRVTFTDGNGNDESLVSDLTEDIMESVDEHVNGLYRGNTVGRPVITGHLRAGATLTIDASGVSDPDGPITDLQYELYYLLGSSTTLPRLRTELGQTTSTQYNLESNNDGDNNVTTFVPEASLVGRRLFAVVHYLDSSGGHTVASVVYGPLTAAVLNAMGNPTITGTAAVGETLTADTSDITDPDGLVSTTFNYQWQRVPADGAAPVNVGGNSSTYDVVAADARDRIRLVVSFRDDDGNSESRTSDATAVIANANNNPATGKPEISGTAKVGESLSTSAVNIGDPDGLTMVSYSYQWQREDSGSATGWANIAGANAATYTLMTADRSKKVRVSLTFSDDLGNLEERTSDAYPDASTVENRDNVPAGGAPTIRGNVLVGEDLMADPTGIMDTNGTSGATFTFQWQRETVTDTWMDIANSTSATLTLTSVDLNMRIRVQVSFTDDDGYPETVASEATVPVDDNNLATGTPEISGTLMIGQTLTAETDNIADMDGLTSVSFEYQWQRGEPGQTIAWTDIVGATTATYRLTANDLSKKIRVKISFADDEDNQEERVSEAFPAGAATVQPAGDGENSSSAKDWAVTSMLTAFGRSVATSLVETVWNRAEVHRQENVVSFASLGGREIDVSAFASDEGEWPVARETAKLLGVETVDPAQAISIDDSGDSLYEGNLDEFISWASLPDGEGIASGSSFSLALGEGDGEGSSLVYWGVGSLSNFSSDLENDRFTGHTLTSDGSNTTISLGLDYRLNESTLLGFAVSSSSGSAEYEFADSEDGSGDLSSSLTGVTPWFRWKSQGGTEFWGAVGIGSGAADGMLDGERVEMDLGAQVIAFGLWSRVTTFGRSGIAAKADYFTATVSSDGAGEEIDSIDAGSSRIRVAAEMSSRGSGSQQSAYALELGARQDDGEAESGFGVDAAAEFDFGGPRSSVRFSGRGGIVLFHGQEGFSETGFSLGITYDPGADDRGLQLTLNPAWNAPNANAADSMWNAVSSNSLKSSRGDGTAVEAGLGYGVNLLGDMALATLYGKVRGEKDEKRLRIGSEMRNLGGATGGFDLDVYGEMRNISDGSERTIMLEGRVGF